MAKGKTRKFRHSDDDEELYDSGNDITEVDDEDLAPPLPKTRKELEEDRKKLKAAVFWSDIVWSDKPDPSDKK
jgi:hypothetical protein